MSTSSALERAITKVLSQKESELVSTIDSAYRDSISNLEASRGKLESERARIIEASKKQAENLKRQIVGSSRLATRNKELLVIENGVNEAFEKARSQLAGSNKSDGYRALVSKGIEDSAAAVGYNEIIVECNKNDSDLIKKIVADLQKKNPKLKARVSDQYIDVLGGTRTKSADGSMSFDNTLDSRIELLKPLIRKNIAQMFRGE